MNGYVIAVFLLVCIATGLLAYRQGYANGQTAVVATTATADSKAKAQTILDMMAELADAKRSAVKLRAQAAKLEVANDQTTAKLRTALAENQKLRACLDARVPADILRQLTAARDRAAASAATGTVDAAVPVPASSARERKHE